MFFMSFVAYWLMLFRYCQMAQSDWRNRRSACLWILVFLIPTLMFILPHIKSEIQLLDNPSVQRLLCCYLGFFTGFISHLPFTNK